MQIRGGNLDYNNDDNLKNKKISRIVLIFIVLIFIAIIAIICTIIYIQNSVFRVYIDGVSVNLPEDTIIIDENSGKIYVDIKGIATYLGYEAHNGEYKLYTEDTNKCWVYCKDETASFFLNSNKISKVEPDVTKDYEDYTIEDPVISRNGKLYCSSEGIKIGFNVTLDYDADTNRLEIYTLPYLVTYYDTVLKNYGYDGVSSDFNNQKAMLYNLFVVRSDNNLYGVINSNNNEIIGSRYRSMQFNENAREFYVSNTSNKVGIVTESGITKINLLYDSITMIDQQNGLYLVRSNNKYGILGNTGDIIIHLEYDQIGVADTTKFPNDTIKNRYVLFENAIPVCQNKKWGLFDINGNMIVPVEFDELGYTAGSTGSLSGKSVNNLLVIPNYKAIVLGKQIDKTTQYGIYNYLGKELVPCRLDNAYSIVSAGVNTYYMEYQGNTLDIEKYIERVHGTTDNLTGTDET